MFYPPSHKGIVSFYTISCLWAGGMQKILKLRPSSLSQKMQWGNRIALLITLAGVILGLFLNNHYLQSTLSSYETTLKEAQSLSYFKDNFIELSYQKQVLSEKLESPINYSYTQIEQELLNFIEASQDFATIWQTLIDTEQIWQDGKPRNLEAVDTIETVNTNANTKLLLKQYDAAFHEYLAHINGLPHQINPQLLEAEKKTQLQISLLQLNQTDFSLGNRDFIDAITVHSNAVWAESRQGYTNLQRALRSQFIVILGSLLISSSIGLFLVYCVTRNLLKPIQEITQVARKSICENHFDSRILVESQDEVGAIARTFNHYLGFIQQILGESVQTQQRLCKTQEELEDAQTHMMHYEKMASLGQLVAGLAHEINNPVSFIHGNINHLRQYVQDLFGLIKLYQQYYPVPIGEIQVESDAIELDFMLEDLPKVLDSMHLGTDRICDIVSSLRSFSRPDDSAVRAVDLHEALDSTLVILHHRLRACADHPAIQVVKNYGEIPLFEGYSGPLKQVFMNIFSNAIDALESEMSQYSYDEIEAFSPYITVVTNLIGQDWIQIAIADNGPGISKELQPKIFEPFFTTKAVHKGTGIGMSISQKIICENHGGTLSCFSTPGEGTIFVIRLPLRSLSNQ